MTDPGRRMAAAVGLAAFTLGLAFLAGDPGGSATRLSEAGFDLMTMLVPPERRPDGVVVVDIDRASLAAKGSWPWRRRLLADLVTRIEAAGPKVVGIDILLAGRDRRSPGPQVEDLARETGRQDLAALAATLPDDDKTLAAAIGSGTTVLGLVLDATSREPPPFPAPLALRGQPSRARLPQSPGVAPPLPVLADASIAIGSLSLEAGPGARVREAPIFVKAAGEVYAGFALEVFRAAQDAAAFVLEDDGASVAVGERRISAAGRRRDARSISRPRRNGGAAPSPPPMSSTAPSRRSAWPGASS